MTMTKFALLKRSDKFLNKKESSQAKATIIFKLFLFKPVNLRKEKNQLK
jgi:hypothetical protein